MSYRTLLTEIGKLGTLGLLALGLGVALSIAAGAQREGPTYPGGYSGLRPAGRVRIAPALKTARRDRESPSQVKVSAANSRATSESAYVNMNVGVTMYTTSSESTRRQYGK